MGKLLMNDFEYFKTVNEKHIGVLGFIIHEHKAKRIKMNIT